MKKAFIGIAIISCSFNAFSQTDTTNSQARHLLDITGSGKLGVQIISNMFESFKKSLPNVPVTFWDEFLNNVNSNDLIELMVPIYAKYYSQAEIKQLIEFYKTPLGQKVIEKTPLIAQDSYLVGQEWGKNIGEKVAAKLLQEGYIKN